MRYITSIFLFSLLGSSLAAKTHTVRISNNAYMPKKIEIQRGDSVKWIHESTFMHSITVDPERLKKEDYPLPHPEDQFDSGQLRNGEEFTKTFSSVGEIHYFCKFHDQMHGIVEVVEKKQVHP